MIQKLSMLAIMTSVVGNAYAGGLEKGPQNTSIIFEEGQYVELSMSIVKPNVTGTANVVVPTPGGPEPMSFESGNVGKNVFNIGLAYKADIDDQWSYAVVYDQPYEADLAYTSLPYPGAPSSAELESHALTGILKKQLPSNMSVYGGLQASSIQGKLNSNPPFPSAGGIPYSVEIDRDYGIGYLIGAAYEKPEIALRTALTYASETEYKFDTTENSVLGNDRKSVTKATMPQSVTLDLQSGIAEDWLAFATIRWAEWSEGTIAPIDFTTIEPENRALVDFKGDRWNYTLGLGHRLNETWSIAGSVIHEPSIDKPMGNLSPKDGFTGYRLGVSYTSGKLNVKTGVQYVEIGDATTEGLGAEFTNNSALAAGVKFGWRL